MSMTDKEKAFWDLCSRHPEGLTDRQMSEESSEFSLESQRDAINSLLKKGLLRIFTSSSGTVIKQVNLEEARRLTGLSPEEKLVYEAIKQKSNEGLWVKELRSISNTPQLTKILRNLESRKLIKAVKSVENKAKKLYMLFELEPSRRLTGGAFYNEELEIDTDFIEVLCKQCYICVYEKSFPRDRTRDVVFSKECHETYATIESVRSFVINSGVSKVDISLEDIESILNVLVYDGKIEKIHGITGSYRAINWTLPIKPVINEIPCGVCPVIRFCSDQGPITPAKCDYYRAWLEY